MGVERGIHAEKCGADARASRVLFYHRSWLIRFQNLSILFDSKANSIYPYHVNGKGEFTLVSPRMGLIEFFATPGQGYRSEAGIKPYKQGFQSSFHWQSFLRRQSMFPHSPLVVFHSQNQRLNYCFFHSFLPALLPRVNVHSLSVPFYPVPVDATPARRTSPATFIVYIVVCFYMFSFDGDSAWCCCDGKTTVRIDQVDVLRSREKTMMCLF